MSYQAITLNDEDADMTNLDLALELQAMFNAKFPNQLAVVSKGCFNTPFITPYLTDTEHNQAHGNGICQNDQFRHSFMVNCEAGKFSADVECKLCPSGTYGGAGISSCIKCDNNEFSGEGATACDSCSN